MIVRSNQNAVAILIFQDLYQITNVRTGVSTYHNGNSYRSYWNRHFRNSRQYVTPNGVNHTSMVHNMEQEFALAV